MYLDLTDVLRGPGQTLEKELNIAPEKLDDIEFAEPVRGTVRVENARQTLVVSGNARTAIVMPCARCLKPSPQPLELEFEAVAPLRFFGTAAHGAHAAQHSHAAREKPDDDDDEGQADDELAALFEGHTLDLLELVRQAIELQAPIKPLCSPDCPGLPEAVQYSAPSGDERWGALKNWQNGDVSEASPDNT